MKNKEKNKTKFLVACNWEEDLIKQLSKDSSDIKYIFGKSKTDVFSGGRPMREVNELEHRNRAESYIKKAKTNNLEFNYLLNGTELNNEFSKETTKKIYENLDWLSSIEIKWVTVCNPRIAQIIKENYSNLNVNISIFAHVRTKRQIEFWQRLGAKSINLDRELVRNTKQLEFLVKSTDLDLILLANDPCLLNCPYELYHDNLMSKNSVTGDKYYHYCSLTCMLEYISNPVEIIKSSFIRPEDISYYENIGIRNFKIVDRNRTTKFIVNAVEAYINRKYNGNLIDLMSIYSSYDRDHENLFQLSNELNEETIDKFWKALPAIIDIKLNNNDVHDLLEKTKNIDCNTLNCDSCEICKKYENRITFNKKDIDKTKENLKRIIDLINSSNTI
jgi:collagenase-like PrtC family protease